MRLPCDRSPGPGPAQHLVPQALRRGPESGSAVAGISIMSTLRENVTGYLAVRRAMGFKVEGLGKLLLSFAAFCEARGATHVQNDLAVEWATATIKVPVNDALLARRMDAVRIFARYQHVLDPATQIPPEAICNRRYRPGEPNVFSEAEVLALLGSCGHLVPAVQGSDVANADRPARSHGDAPR